jgi:hypothetical protein
MSVTRRAAAKSLAHQPSTRGRRAIDPQSSSFYNFNRPHGSLDEQTPYERLRPRTTESPSV